MDWRNPDNTDVASWLALPTSWWTLEPHFSPRSTLIKAALTGANTRVCCIGRIHRSRPAIHRERIHDLDQYE